MLCYTVTGSHFSRFTFTKINYDGSLTVVQASNVELCLVLVISGMCYVW